MNETIIKNFDKSSVNFWDGDENYNEESLFKSYASHKQSIILGICLEPGFLEFIGIYYAKIERGGRVTDVIRGGEKVSGVKNWKEYGKEMIYLFLQTPNVKTLFAMNLKLSFVEKFISENEIQISKEVIKNFNRIKSIKNVILSRNQRLVYSVVKKYKKSTDLEVDLLQEGSMGLIYAIDMFNPNQDIKFSTYSSWWIRQFISKNIFKQESSIHVPAAIQSSTNKAIYLFQEFKDVEIVAEKMDIPISKVYKFLSNSNYCASLNVPIGDDTEEEKINLIADRYSIETRHEEKNQVTSFLNHLDNREKMVIRMRYGIDVRREFTLDEVGITIGVTRERARQIEKNAIKKIQSFNLT